MMPSMTFTQRMLGAAQLDARVFEEVERDPEATRQAVAVVVLAAVAAGLGTGHTLAGTLGGAVAALLSWLIWAWIIWLVGTRWLPEPQTQASARELLRTLGFAASPGLLRIFVVLPLLGPLVMVVTAVWMLMTMVVAVKQALDFRSTGRAIGVCLIGWALHLLIFATLLRLLRGGWR
jgi:hypothetical protein